MISYRKEARSYLREWLNNWHLGYYEGIKDTSFTITYNNGFIKHIHIQDYDGENVKKQHIKNIEVLDAWSNFDFNGDIN